MSPRIRISRQGFTNCPSCKAHVRVEGSIHEARCYFCQAPLLGPGDTVSAESGLSRVVSAGRSGLLAASLLGIGAVAGCDGTSNGAIDVVVVDTAPDITVAPVYGEPADVVAPVEDTIVDVAPDSTDQPMYGEPADITSPDASQEDVAVDEDAAPDAAPQALYGLPPGE